ncbi:MAG: tripartite tricarboxylate transporter substrate-binding protein, partial [Gemmatimonadaceae bacterium]
MRISSRPVALLLAVALPVIGGTAAAQRAAPPLTIIAPAAPGGGWDQLARTMQRALEVEGIVSRVQVENIPGAAGTVGLARFVSARRGDPDALLITGLVMVGGISQNASPVTLEQTTPLARLVGEYEVLVVPMTSPYRTLAELLTDFGRTPASIAWGGGSAGGTDQILVDLIAAARGIDPRRANYVAFSGGGEATAALLGGQVTVGVSGLGEFAPLLAEGRVRALAISSPERVAGVDTPTLREQGVAVDVANWRGIVAPPGISPARRLALTQELERLVRSPAWRAELTRRGWDDLWLPGEGFSRFLAAEAHRVDALVAARRGVRTIYSSAALSRLPLLLGALLAVLLGIVAVRSVRSVR